MKFLAIVIACVGALIGIIIVQVAGWINNEFGYGGLIAIAVGIYIMYKLKDFIKWYKNR